MGVIVPIDEAQVALVWKVTARTDEMVSTIGVRPQVSMSAPTIATAVYASALGSGLMVAANTSNQGTIVGVRAYLQTASGFIQGDDIVNVVGTRSVGPPPPQCAVLCQKRTGFGGRRNRGRMFLPGLLLDEAAEVSAAGEINGTRRGQIEGYVDAFLTALDGNDLTPVLFHSDGSASTVISSLTVLSTLATQRSRIR